MEKINKKVVLFFTLLLLTACNSIDELYKMKNDLLNKDHLSLSIKKYPTAEYSSTPLVSYILDPKDSVSIRYFNHIRKICDYTKIPFNFKSTLDWNTSAQVINTTRVLVIANSNAIQTKSIDSLVKFVANGGTIFLPQTTEDKRFGYLLGIKPRANYYVDVNSKGIYFEKDVIPGLTNTSIKNNQKHFGLLSENFSEKINVLAWSDAQKKYPYYIENKIGMGKVVYFNSLNFLEKADRGLLFSAILNGLEGIPYPIANTNSIFLDDFPSPMYEQKQEPIKSEMNLNMADFVYKAWWPDMKKLAVKYNLKYTSLITFDYDNKTNPPFLFNQWDNCRRKIDNRKETISNWLVNDLSLNGHEKAFHGYNHISLTKKEWENPDNILTSFKAAQKKWQVNGYGDFPISFVPSSNVIDEYGLKNLEKAMPSIKYVCSVYLGDLKEGGDRDFDLDPYNPNFFDYPRISSGFEVNDDANYEIQSMYLYTGIWTHFVHPDDVYQTPANGTNMSSFDLRNPKNLGWRKSKNSKSSLLSSFDQYISKQKKLHTLAQYKTVKEAAPIVINWRASKFKHTQNQKYYTVQNITKKQTKKAEPTSWFVYFDSSNINKFEGQIKKQSKKYDSTPILNGRLYTFISYWDKITFNHVKPKLELKKMLLLEAEYLAYRKEQFLYLSGAFEPKWEDYDLKLKKEKAMLLSRMLSEPEIDYEVWDKYAFYASWDNLGHEVWKLLEKHCEKYPSKHNVMYSYNLEKILGYPEVVNHSKWIALQYKWNPDYLPTLKEYLGIIITGSNKKEIEIVLKKIYLLESNKNNQQEYLYYIIANNKDTARTELDLIKPSGAFDDNLISDIAWFYKSSGEFQKALDWAVYAKKIPFSSRLLWMYELGKYPETIAAYQEYIEKNPDDLDAKITMVNIYHAIGKFKEAWILAASLPEGKDKSKLKEFLNRDVIYVEEPLQDELLKEKPEFFTAQAKAYILDYRRKNYGNFIDTNSEYSSFLFKKVSFENYVSYNHFDKNKNLHSFFATHKNMFPLLNIDFIENIIDEDNIAQTLYGFRYNFKHRIKKKWHNFSYHGGAGLEFNNKSKSYYNLDFGMETNNEQTSTSFNVSYNPINTSAAYVKNIYDLKLRAAFNTHIYKLASESVIQGDYFDKQNIYSLFANTRLKLKLNKEHWFKLTPIVELGLSKSTAKQDLFYPYFVIKEQIYGGAGAGFYLGRENSKFKFNSEGLYFSDTKANKFINLRGNLEYNLLKYTYIKGGYDLFFQNQYQSNVANLGLKYIF
jgi:hypothetical protein